MADVSKLRRRAPVVSLRLAIPFKVVATAPMVSDFSVIVFACLSASLFYKQGILHKPPQLDAALGAGMLAGFLFCCIAFNLRIYSRPHQSSLQDCFLKLFACWTGVALALSAALFLLREGELYSRVDALFFYAFGLVFIFVDHATWRSFVARVSRDGRVVGSRAVLIGEADELRHLNSSYLSHLGFNELRRFVITAHQVNDLESIVQKSLIYARRVRAKEVVFAVGWQEDALLRSLSGLVRATPLPVTLLPDRATRSLADRHMPWTTASTLSLELKRAPLSRVERGLKRIVDVAGASIGLIFLLPLFVVVALAIKSESVGPVFFCQRRAGFNRKIFWIYKFRSMSVLEDGAVIRQANRADNRVTRVGRILRRTSIDEIPQLLNVILGDMSLVGPRPHALAHDMEYKKEVAQYASRHHVKPGITGWAQVNGLRGETASVGVMAKRVEKDLWYIDNWSFWLDFWILAKTVLLLRDENAY